MTPPRRSTSARRPEITVLGHHGEPSLYGTRSTQGATFLRVYCLLCALEWPANTQNQALKLSEGGQSSMRMHFVTLAPGQPDPILLHRLVVVQQVCLALAAQIAAVTLLAGIFKPVAYVFSIACSRESVLFGLAALLSAIGLFISDESHAHAHVYICRLLALLTGLIGALVAGTSFLHNSVYLPAILGRGFVLDASDGLVQWEATGFVFLAVSMLLSPSHSKLIRYIADGVTWVLCFVTLSAISLGIYSAVRLHGIPASNRASVVVLACLAPITVVAALRQAGHGAFSIFHGHGLGGKIARIIGPAILLIHFLREFVMARLSAAHLLPVAPVVAVLTSLGTSIMFVLLLFLVWRIDRMEQKIHELSLRDELTRLYNLRGFNLLAEQALRMANRSGMPFSVLFIDLDNLKLINDRFGHNAGSKALVETAQLLTATFREIDVIGRVGGDEFVVAGPFASRACTRAIERLCQAASLHNAREGKRFPLTFSVGTATSQEGPHTPLHVLIKRADEAMYEHKRAKKTEIATGPAVNAIALHG